jgi:predicted nucleotidyltransferase
MEKQMRITTDQSIAGYPALQVREFVRKYRFTNFSARAAEAALMLSTEAAANFLSKLADLGYIGKSREQNGNQLFQLTSSGQALANASAAKPIHRKTAARVLAQFLERVHKVNASPEYLFRVKNVVLFGSILSHAERLGDVDIAISLEAKVSDTNAYQAWSMARRDEAEAAGRYFHTLFESGIWPRQEVLLQLKARSRSLSLHELEQIATTPNLCYRVLLGDPEQLAAWMPSGRAI